MDVKQEIEQLRAALNELSLIHICLPETSGGGVLFCRDHRLWIR